MFDLFRLWLGAVLRGFRTRRSLMLENLALRQQLAVFKRHIGCSPEIPTSARHSLVQKIVDDESIIRIGPSSSVSDPTSYTLTDFGVMFIAACRGSNTVA